VNEPARDMESRETAESCDQKDHKQYRPDADTSPMLGVKKIELCLLFSRSAGCTLRPFPSGALTDPFAEVRNFVGDVGSRLVTAGRCD
jgi:hypothetical protein